ncbi:hypothetical protein Cni_G03355 [Canna indica]|uniref:Uncharacterized protein n=1 Tax=Canna indica TaxID=4628 RepID=A0AAQ3Q144_9LILI|nr:hypothetical protein Cni_G03355 [Canna indica]
MIAAASLPLPGDKPNRRPRHARSCSAPSPSHPVLSRLHALIHSLRHLDGRGTAAALLALARLHAALDDLLRLPLARDPLLSCGPRLLDDFLRLADAHGSFRSAALALKQHLSEARTAIRRRDAGRLATAVRAHRRAEKELALLAAAVGDLARVPPAAGLQAEVAEVMSEAVAASAAASAAVFAGVAGVSAAATAAASTLKRPSWAIVGALRKLLAAQKKGTTRAEAEMSALERLEEAEECIEGMEKGSEKVYRSLMNTRVSLLNILTPSL